MSLSSELESAAVDFDLSDEPLELSSLTQIVFSSGLSCSLFLLDVDALYFKVNKFERCFFFLTYITATSLMAMSI